MLSADPVKSISLEVGNNVTLHATLNVPTDADWNILDLKQSVETDFVLVYVDNRENETFSHDLGVEKIQLFLVILLQLVGALKIDGPGVPRTLPLPPSVSSKKVDC